MRPKLRLMREQPREYTEAEFLVVRGPLRAGERHPRRRAWQFTGRYNDDGHPLFYNRWRDGRFVYGGIAKGLALLVAAAVLLLVIAITCAAVFAGAK